MNRDDSMGEIYDCAMCGRIEVISEGPTKIPYMIRDEEISGQKSLKVEDYN